MYSFILSSEKYVNNLNESEKCFENKLIITYNIINNIYNITDRKSNEKYNFGKPV